MLTVNSLALILLVLFHRVVNARTPKNNVTARLRRALTPAAIILVAIFLRHFAYYEVNVAGSHARASLFFFTLVIHLASVWILWLMVQALFEGIILSPKISDQSLDANLLRLGARVIGFVGGAMILVYGAQDLGLPVLGLLAGLGVGGFAVALAVRPTLENLIGGVILYLDRPVRVGDVCSFGDKFGTVESIGVRSTQIRALDRTLISIPNATFADMEIVNWAKCDRMLILSTIDLRRETEPDQLRYVLARIREMLHAHPRIHLDTVRVRFVGYGESSFTIQIRAYALTREWNDFYAIREDVFLRVNQIVAESGTGFAMPSQTLYIGRDAGLNRERSEAAADEVAAWRESGQLPFPVLPASRIDQLANTLDYPPRGSARSDAPGADPAEAPELLSAEPPPEDGDETDRSSAP